MTLTAKGKFIDTKPMERLLTQGEKYADKIHFVLPAINNDVNIVNCSFVIRTVASDGSMTETGLTAQRSIEQVLLTWDVPESVTAVAGMLQMELVGIKDSDIIIKYKMPAVFIKGAVMGDHLPPPDVIEEKLAQMNGMLAQAQAKLDEAKDMVVNISSDIIDKTLTISDKAADAKITGDRIEDLSGDITKIDNLVKGILTNISDGAIGQTLMEVINARTSSITSEEFPSLSERLESDFSYLKKVMRAVDIISSYIEISVEDCGEDLEAVISADEALRISGTGSINERAFEKREDFSTLIIDIGGDVGMGAFGGCENLSEITVNCNKINSKAFWACTRLHWLNIGKSVSEIGSGIISNSAFYIPSGVRVMYDGTMEEWNAITKAADWIGDQVTVENNVVVCSDGEVEV